MKRQLRILNYICLAIFVISTGCSILKASDNDETFKYQVSNAYPHDPDAQTEGLIYMEGFLYEGTGPCLNGPSGLRRVEIETGKVLKIRELPEPLFGEGITIYGDRIIQLTYTTKTGFIYDKQSLEPLGDFRYLTEEGWGLTHDGTYLIMSDGSATLHYLDPLSFQEVKQIQVHDNRSPVYNLNELEFIRGEIYANIFQTPMIVRISPETGRILGYIDLSILLKGKFENPKLVNLANGIAYDTATGRLFITGKYWPNLFEIKIVSIK